MRSNGGETATMLSATKCEIASLLSPVEADTADNSWRNQARHAINYNANILTAVGREKTVGWLLEGETILEMRIDGRSISEESKQEIQQNPLWVREIRLAEFQQKRHS